MGDNLLQFPGTVTVRHAAPGEAIELVFNDGGRTIVKPISDELALLIAQALPAAVYSNLIHRARVLANQGIHGETMKEVMP